MADPTVFIPWEDLKTYLTAAGGGMVVAISVLWGTHVRYISKAAQDFGAHLEAIHKECERERAELVSQAERERADMRIGFAEHRADLDRRAERERTAILEHFEREREFVERERKNLVRRIDMLENSFKQFGCGTPNCDQRSTAPFVSVRKD